MSLLDRKKKKKDILNYPWEKYYKPEDRNIDVPDISIYEYFEKSCFTISDEVALNYFGVKMTFKELIENIDLCSKSYRCYGVRSGDVISICMPNTPEAIIAFYAANKIGAVVNFIHPLSSEDEIKDTLGFTVNIGIANNKLCAKMASDFEKPNKVHTLFDEEVKEKMWPLPIDDLFGDACICGAWN